MPSFGESFKNHLGKFRAAPFLFVGAGLSRRYLELDGWDALLRRMASLTHSNFDYYYASAEGDLPGVARLIAADLHPVWWNDPAFESSREHFAEFQLEAPDSALKAEASLYLQSSIDRLGTVEGLNDELELLRSVVVDGVITTNFDPLLETLFPDFKVFVGQENLLFGDALGVGEIYKIHGSHEDPDSLVLTTADYERFNERNPYLAAKLMTIFVEHPIIFLGYSMSDRNVASILHSIVACLDSNESISKLADRLIFIQWDGEAEEPTFAQSVLRVDEKPVPVMTASVSDFEEVFSVLGSLRRGFPAKLLRQLKEQVYDLVLEDEPKGRLHVAQLGPDDNLGDVEVVFGVGAIERLRSYQGLSRQDLIDEVIDEVSELTPARVIQEGLPGILSQPGNVPIFKYLRAAGLLDSDGDLIDSDSVDPKVKRHVENRADRLKTLSSYEKSASLAIKNAGSLKNLIENETPQHVLHYLPSLDEEKIDPEELRRFLIKNENLCENGSWGPQWTKKICLYDWLLSGRQIKPRPKRGRRPQRRATSGS